MDNARKIMYMLCLARACPEAVEFNKQKQKASAKHGPDRYSEVSMPWTDGRLIDTFVLTWVHERGTHKAAAFNQCAYLDNLPRNDLKTVRLEVHVNDDGIANVGRLNTKHHHVQHAERTAFP